MKATQTKNLQGIGTVGAVKAEELMIGMKLCWNYSIGEYVVENIEKISKCFYKLTEKNIKSGKTYERKIKNDKLIGVATIKEEIVFI